MNTSDNLMVERLESLKAGILAALCVLSAFGISSLINSLVLAKYFPELCSLGVELLNLQFLVSGAIASFSGLLFGVTYRYIIRQDQNPQLKDGGVLAFGLARGLAQIDVGFACSGDVLPFVVMTFEGVLWFKIAAIALDAAIQRGWVKPFGSKP
ncbi:MULTISPECIES: hypothetical protein [Fischerella]|uniref:Uncharacterized protein n=1 Tax=Fischerella muscicola CCMEE 5323 TaxID=2019572 RepID=A0A2N6JZ21_FISMU|nr:MULTISPECIES: hypothetical protein [Fischerella]PLZ86404.1 hypothetical protein CEN44_20035 [Fischerella muscicola CCMEE 5323]